MVVIWGNILSFIGNVFALAVEVLMSGVDTGKMVSITFALQEDPTALVILCMQTIQVGKFFIYAHKQTAHITIPPAPAILFPAPAVFLPW